MANKKNMAKTLETCWRYNTELMGAPLRLLKYSAGLQQRTNKQHFLVACMPKSGSTYFSSIVECLPNVHRRDLCGGYGRREQELDPLRLILNHPANYVGQLHVRCSDQTERLMTDFSITPVVLVRNIFDIIVSLRDHCKRETLDWSSMGYAYPFMAGWDHERLEFFLANMFIPWYFNFFLTWKNSDFGYFETYENLISDPRSTLARLLKVNGSQYSSADISRAIELAGGVDTRRNVGEVGRGGGLSDAAKDRILEMANFYEDEDFSILGIS